MCKLHPWPSNIISVSNSLCVVLKNAYIILYDNILNDNILMANILNANILNANSGDFFSRKKLCQWASEQTLYGSLCNVSYFFQNKSLLSS